MRAVVHSAAGSAHVLTDAEQFERIECLLSRRPSIGEVRKAIEFLPERLLRRLRPEIEAKGYGAALS